MTTPRQNHEPKTVFGRLAVFVLGHQVATVLSIVGLVLASVLLVTTKLGIDSDLLSLLPEETETVVSMRHFDDVGMETRRHSFAVRGDPSAVRPFFEQLETSLMESGIVRYVLYDVEPDLKSRLGLLQLPRSDLESIRDRLRGALALGRGASNPFVAASLFDLGPLTERFSTLDSGEMLFADDDIAQMVVQPSTSADDVAFAREFMALFNQLVVELEPEDNGVEVLWVGGSYRHTAEDYEGVVADMRWTGFLAAVFIVGLLAVAFRDFRVLLLVFLPLTVGTILSFGFAAITVQDLNSFTGFFGAVLIGLGIDFSIHLFSRYREERVVSSSLHQAIVRAWDASGPPCFAAALTTAGGFFALMVADFRGFKEFGFLLGAGVLLCLLSVLFILPLLIGWWEKKPTPYKKKKRRNLRRRPPTYRYATLSLALLVLVTVLFGAGLKNLGIEYDISNLRRHGMSFEEMTDVERQLAQDAYSPVLVGFDSETELLEAHNRVAGLIEAGDLPYVNRVVSRYSLIPNDQFDRLAALREISLMVSHSNFGFLPPTVRNNITALTSVSLDPLSLEELPGELREMVGAVEGADILVLMANGNMWDMRRTHALAGELRGLFPGAQIAGGLLLSGDIYSMARRDAPMICLMAFLFIALATFADLRSKRLTLAAVGVLATGMVWAGSTIALFEVKISLLNVVGVAILLGIGVGIVIHLLHRLREEGPGRVRFVLSTTGWAAGLSALTTALSFAAISMSGGRGIRGLGLLVLIGLISLTIAAFLILPTGWMTAWKLGGKLPETMEDMDVYLDGDEEG
jgi:uncharacterized protein